MPKLLVGQPFVLILFLAAFADIAFAKAPRSPQEQPPPLKGTSTSVRPRAVPVTRISLRSSATTPHRSLKPAKKKAGKTRAASLATGPGQAHVDAGDGSQIFVFTKVSAREVSKNCLTCHAKTEAHAGSPTSLHGKNQLACTDCHSVHQPKKSLYLLTEKPDPLCFSCHKETQSAFAKPFRHRLQEGAIHCVDCHAPHGGLNPRQMKTARGNEIACAKCHSDNGAPLPSSMLPCVLRDAWLVTSRMVR